MNIVLMDRVEQVSFTANYVGKVYTNMLVNPNIIYYHNAATLMTPSSGTEVVQVAYNLMMALDASVSAESTSTNTFMAQRRFSFDLISLIERLFGTIPAADTAGKVARLKANITSLSCGWWGYGSGPSGNNAFVSSWNNSTLAWLLVTNHTLGSITKQTATITDIINRVDSNGFCHFLAYAEASNGTTASTINTDYVELTITLNVRR